MKTHEEMVEEVYNDTNFKGEFKSYVRLANAIKNDMATSLLPIPAWSKERFDSLTYKEIVAGPIIATELKQQLYNAQLLYSSLENALSIKYAIDFKKAKNLVIDVASLYERSK